MSKNRIFLILVVLSALLVTVAVSSPFSKAPASNPAGANDFYQRHSDWAQTSQIRGAIFPVTGRVAASDYYERHPELNERTGAAADTSDYSLRHPELFQGTNAIDTSDYFFRH